jgi:hypothetical protein
MKKSRPPPCAAPTSTRPRAAKPTRSSFICRSPHTSPNSSRPGQTRWPTRQPANDCGVYCVAITRARCLVTLTYPYSKHADVTAHLDALKVEYRVEVTGPHPEAS